MSEEQPETKNPQGFFVYRCKDCGQQFVNPQDHFVETAHAKGFEARLIPIEMKLSKKQKSDDRQAKDELIRMAADKIVAERT